MNKEFCDLSNEELNDTNGGFVVSAFIIGVAVGGCLTAGAIYGYKKESQGK